jgi:hypothetical protein
MRNLGEVLVEHPPALEAAPTVLHEAAIAYSVSTVSVRCQYGASAMSVW